MSSEEEEGKSRATPPRTNGNPAPRAKASTAEPLPLGEILCVITNCNVPLLKNISVSLILCINHGDMYSSKVARRWHSCRCWCGAAVIGKGTVELAIQLYLIHLRKAQSSPCYDDRDR